MSFFQKSFLGRNNVEYYILTTFAVLIAYVIGQFPMTGVLLMQFRKSGEDVSSQLMAFNENPDFEAFGIDSNLGFLLLLLMFVFAMLAFVFMLRKLHKKRLHDITTSKQHINWNKILFGFFLWLVLTGLMELVFHVVGWNNYTFEFQLSKFLPLLLISLLILPIQTSLEEFFFRGYLLQGFSVFFKNKYVPLIITSVLFGLIHSANPEVSKYGFWNMQFYYVSVGLFLGIITVMDDSLELALGVHAATNFYGATLVGYQGSAIQTASIFKSEIVNTTLMTIAFLLIAFIFYIIVSKKYSFTNIDYLFEKVNKPQKVTV